ncbi:unnamed protein product [Paramecium primaurelia]|uniref:Uncharacterized protein n=1 Tax=Paramecium primaurelia TaxID=5886 RepID=A0A8S1Q3V0_PARPR|nr:unnamed protein product [Paramecium primaurelia]
MHDQLFTISGKLRSQINTFPLLKPFNGNISKSKIAAIKLFAIKQFIRDNPKSSLEEIIISSQGTQVIR